MARNLQLVSVVVPTYNERDNLPALVAGIDKHITTDYEIIVVDDGSPDGTADVARELATEYPVRLLSRGAKLGLGSAYRAGFRLARGDAVLEMDADLSHDPRHIPGLLEAVERGASMAVGSRYVHGGAIRNWGPYRKVVSGVGNGLARTILGLGSKDCTSGFRCYAADWKHLVTSTKSDGYAFQVEVLYLAKKWGATVAEVPIIFENRTVGKSKLGASEFGKFLATLGRLRVSSMPAMPPALPTGPTATLEAGVEAPAAQSQEASAPSQ
ncbi:MAG TPA: polyprenol monophosphomannose synthase [Candidatus Thermoplasmatota archaeon]|nr:polyprenol monophosphomannose synthase [Candidatus Thermoplasmatota archaeon]